MNKFKKHKVGQGLLRGIRFNNNKSKIKSIRMESVTLTGTNFFKILKSKDACVWIVKFIQSEENINVVLIKIYIINPYDT